jgi:hypothetical protein
MQKCMNKPRKQHELEALIERVEQTERPEWAKTTIDVSAAITPLLEALFRIGFLLVTVNQVVSLLKP